MATVAVLVLSLTAVVGSDQWMWMMRQVAA